MFGCGEGYTVLIFFSLHKLLLQVYQLYFIYPLPEMKRTVSRTPDFHASSRPVLVIARRAQHLMRKDGNRRVKEELSVTNPGNNLQLQK